MSTSTIKLYGFGPSRWVRPYWTLQELGVPFEPVRVNLRAGENRSPEYLAINPFGAVPTLVDGDVVLTQSAAICTYLADRFPEKGLAPPAGTPDRGRHDQWVAFAVADLEQPLWRIARHTFRYPEEKRSAAEKELAADDFRKLARTLEPLLGEYAACGRFTVADIMLAYTLRWASGYKLLDEFPGLAGYAARHVARPAFPAHLFG